MLAGIPKLERRINDLMMVFNPGGSSLQRNDPGVAALDSTLAHTVAEVLGEGSAMHNRFRPEPLDNNMAADFYGIGERSIESYREEIRQGIGRESAKLQSVIKLMREAIEDAEHTRDSGAMGISVDMNPQVERGVAAQASRQGSIFIGHGRSPVWRELQMFIQDRLEYKCIEFNSDAVAGIATTQRLESMLDSSGLAFLVMTAEDEHADKSLRARPNVIHEVGLFQGKLGFRRAIVLLEEGCDDFSNIHGMTHISFPAHRISAAFEDVRRVVEREKASLLPLRPR